MAQNITLLGASYSSVPAVTLPKTGGGTAQFDDTTDANATASDIASGKTAYVNGVKLTGTSSGGITPTGTSTITANGIYDVTNFASASVSVPVGVFPTGTSSITANGIYDITSFASVDVNVSGGGGGDTDAEDGIVTRQISGTYTNSRVTTIGSAAFMICSSLTGAIFPNVTTIGSSAFMNCSKLATVSFPKVTSIYASAFTNCSALTAVDFPNAVSLGVYTFSQCSSLAMASFPKASLISGAIFQRCRMLRSLYLLGSSVVPLGTSTVFSSTPISNYTTYTGGAYGSIYVPASLVDSYKSATNWSRFSSRITAYTG